MAIIIKYVEHVIGQCVRVTRGEDVATPTPTTVTEIKGADYDDLMSASPAWAPGKPAGTFRESDLLHFTGI